MSKFFSVSSLINFINLTFKSLIILQIIFFIVGIYYSFFNSPADYQQGEYVRIMYIHVPCAWLSLAIYSFMAVCSFVYLVWRNPVFDLLAKSAAPTGAFLCFITLVTGALWGKPTWGTWWVWDARLTSMLILFFFYLGYLFLDYLTYDKADNRSAAALAIVGFINVPIVKFSVNLWNSLHQPASILRSGGPSIHSSMLVPLFLMFITLCFYFIINLFIAFKRKVLMQKISRQRLQKFNNLNNMY